MRPFETQNLSTAHSSSSYLRQRHTCLNKAAPSLMLRNTTDSLWLTWADCFFGGLDLSPLQPSTETETFSNKAIEFL